MNEKQLKATKWVTEEGEVVDVGWVTGRPSRVREEWELAPKPGRHLSMEGGMETFETTGWFDNGYIRNVADYYVRADSVTEDWENVGYFIPRGYEFFYDTLSKRSSLLFQGDFKELFNLEHSGRTCVYIHGDLDGDVVVQGDEHGTLIVNGRTRGTVHILSILHI